ncbi:MAG: GTPase HflX [Gammaproteobacteria bacterium]|nr:GTPase HflX [Gammaproteobacteria bacterium]
MGEKALLVHIALAGQPLSDDQIQEFQELARSAGADEIRLVTGSRQKPDPRFFVGSGKVREIADLVRALQIELVIFNQRLSPSQERNLEKAFSCRVLDRTGLILDIFAQRANTFEGKLQVELAQLNHLSTRLVRGWTHLERQKGGIGLRGPGETQLETDRRLLALRVKSIRKRLARVRQQREQSRQARNKSGVPSIALVGYTNAGKSTLFNALTGQHVYAADKLFATLDPTYRKLPLPGGREAVIIDTVGFISDLPHELVDAFRSTLLETREANLLIHVVDACDELRDQRIEDVNQVLNSIDAGEVPVLMAYNKIDKLAVGPHLDRDELEKPLRVWISANSGAGLELLIDSVVELIDNARVHGLLKLKPSAGEFRAKLYSQGAVVSESFNDDGDFLLEIDADRIIWQRLCDRFELDDSALMRQSAGELAGGRFET